MSRYHYTFFFGSDKGEVNILLNTMKNKYNGKKWNGVENNKRRTKMKKI